MTQITPPFLDRTSPPTAQDIFDFAVRAIHRMPHRAIKPGTALCQYRTGNPTCPACVVGQLLTDDEVRIPESLKGKDSGFNVETLDDLEDISTVVGSLGQHGLLPSRLLQHVLLLTFLQKTHDNPDLWEIAGPAHPRLMPEALIYLATRHNLNHEVVRELWPEAT